jgi:hypothetical protein
MFVCVCECECVCVCERERVCVCECLCVWVCVCEWVSVSECVFEWGYVRHTVSTAELHGENKDDFPPVPNTKEYGGKETKPISPLTLSLYSGQLSISHSSRFIPGKRTSVSIKYSDRWKSEPVGPLKERSVLLYMCLWHFKVWWWTLYVCICIVCVRACVCDIWNYGVGPRNACTSITISFSASPWLFLYCSSCTCLYWD